MADRPDDVDAAFAAIVADLEREGVGAGLPDLDASTDTATDIASDTAATTSGSDKGTESREPEGKDTEADPPAKPAAPPPAGWRGQQTEWDWSWSTDEEHYVPPEPPPLPRLRPLTIVALALLMCALVLLVAPSAVGLDPRIGTPLALVALICGGAMLLLRIRQSPKDPDDGRDDGAQL